MRSARARARTHAHLLSSLPPSRPPSAYIYILPTPGIGFRPSTLNPKPSTRIPSYARAHTLTHTYIFPFLPPSRPPALPPFLPKLKFPSSPIKIITYTYMFSFFEEKKAEHKYFLLIQGWTQVSPTEFLPPKYILCVYEHMYILYIEVCMIIYKYNFKNII
jgi:hypothetical protein